MKRDNMGNKRRIKVGRKIIGGDETFIIAEAGSNHRQDINIAYDLISAAKESGADAVKFQSVNIGELYYDPSTSIKKLHKLIDLKEEWHYKLKEFADKKDIIFFSSPTYIKAVDTLEKIGVLLYKLASAQVGTFPQIIELVASLKKPAMLSTGLVTYKELENAISIFYRAHNHNFVILHCNSIYPTPYIKVNLPMIQVYENMFGNPAGFSDHTIGIHVAIAAVSMGAKVIEKHLTVDKKILTPDSAISLNPQDFKMMVSCIREIEQSLRKSPRIEIDQEESKFKDDIIYRLILDKDKKRGETFSKDDFIFKRHHEGIDCRDLNMVVNCMQARYDLKKRDILSWDKLEGKN